MYSYRSKPKIAPCKKCGRNCEVRPADEIFCDECIYEFKQEFLEKHSLKKGQTVYTLITGSKKDAYTVRQYKIHKIEFRNWFYSYEDESNLDFNFMDNRFSIILKSTTNNSTLERNLDEIFNTEEDCLTANKEKISAHMLSVSKKQFLKAIENQLDNGLKISLDDDYIKQLINKTIQETNFKQQKILSIEKSQPVDETYTNCINIVNMCHKLVKQLDRTDNQLESIFNFGHTSALLGGMVSQCLAISIEVIKNNKTLYNIYKNNDEDDYLNWMLGGKCSFEKWLEQHKEDKQ